jgi:hypothetical protein
MSSMTTHTVAWDRFGAMAKEVHEMLIGGAQCRNHLRALLEAWDEMGDKERKEATSDALERLVRVGI